MSIHHIFTGSEEDQEATEMLVGNAQNLMQAVKETVRAISKITEKYFKICFQFY
jgi:hypothetical protein